MSHKKNDLSYSEGGINRQASLSATSQSSNPWGVSLKKLSFKASGPPPVQQLHSHDNQATASSKKREISRPKRPKSAKQRVVSPRAAKAQPTNHDDSKQHHAEPAEFSPPPAFSPSPQPTIGTDQADNDALRASRAKKRQLRQKLSLAKMEMSVLKARLGLEQQMNATTPAIAEEKSQENGTPQMSPQSSHNHDRSVSVSTENLFTKVDSFESDIKEAIEKVEELVSKVNKTESVTTKQQEQLKQENQRLKAELDEIKKKLQSVQDENAKLKSKVNSASNNAKPAANNQAAGAQPAAQKAPEEYKPDPMEKYNKLKDLGMSVDNIVNKMKKAGVEEVKIEEWKQKNSSRSADQVMASKVNAKEELYAKYDKMKKMGLQEDSIRSRMKLDGLKDDEIERYLKGANAAAAAAGGGGNDDDAFKQKMAKYARMKKIGMPEVSVRNKMTMDGISKEDQERFFNPDAAKKADANKPNPKLAKYEKMKKMGMPMHAIANKMKLDGFTADEIAEFENPGSTKKGEEEEESKPNPKLAKYERMKKMGMPLHAIVNKMKLDGFTAEEIAEFENPGSTKKAKKKKVKATDPALEKYYRMKNAMGMPMNAIVNKMRLDGIPQSQIYKFEHQEDEEEEEEEEEDEDPNEANAIDLNIPALAKYHRMKKMGMPTHAIVNKMKLDNIDKSLIEAFENPDAAKKKKKKGGLGGLFHKRKTSIPPKEKIKPNVDMKRFHWQTVDYKLARNSIWRTMDETSVTQKLDIPEFETLFSVPKKENKLKSLLGGKKAKEKEEKKNDEIKFVSAKRQYNVELLLKRLKLNGEKLCQDIIEMNKEKLNLELLIKISDMVPSDEEQMQAIGNSNNGDKERVKKYGVVERFFYDLSSVWSIQERIKTWIFSIEFGEIVQNQMDKVTLLDKALSDIQGSEALYEVFRVVLAFGNYMNGGRRNGQAYGFSLETLRMLSGTKASDGQTTLLMYIYKYCAEQVKGKEDEDEDEKKGDDKPKKGKGKDTSSGFASKVVAELENVQAAVKVDIEALDKKIKELDDELKKMEKRLKEFEKHTKKDKKDKFVEQMKAWMKSAKEMIEKLKKAFKAVDKRAIDLASTYAYKLEPGQINDFLKIFDDFVKDWNKAKIKHTKLEEKKKKDALRAKKKEEAQKKLQAKLDRRKVTKLDLEKRHILKDVEKVKKEQAAKAKLKLTMKAHVRKQTAMQQMFGNVLNQSDEEEETDTETDDPQAQQYQSYVHQYQLGGGGKKGIVTFNPDDIGGDEQIGRMQSDASNSTVVHHDAVNSRGLEPLTDIHRMDSTSSDMQPSPIATPDEMMMRAQTARADSHKDEEQAAMTRAHTARADNRGDRPQMMNGAKSHPHPGKKKKNDRSETAQHKFRGKGRTPTNHDSKYDYASSGGVFQRRKEVPTATQYGNVWEMNFTPMSRMAYSNSKKRDDQNKSPKKKKKVKYKAGHVRRETRLKHAFDQMKTMDVDAVAADSPSDSKSPTKAKEPNTQQAVPKTDATTPRSKGAGLYSKYRKNRTFNKPANSNVQVEDF